MRFPFRQVGRVCNWYAGWTHQLEDSLDLLAPAPRKSSHSEKAQLIPVGKPEHGGYSEGRKIQNNT